MDIDEPKFESSGTPKTKTGFIVVSEISLP